MNLKGLSSIRENILEETTEITVTFKYIPQKIILLQPNLSVKLGIQIKEGIWHTSGYLYQAASSRLKVSNFNFIFEDNAKKMDCRDCRPYT